MCLKVPKPADKRVGPARSATPSAGSRRTIHFSDTPFPPRLHVRKLPPSYRLTKRETLRRAAGALEGCGVRKRPRRRLDKRSATPSLPLLLLGREDQPPTPREIVAGALTRGGVGHGFQRRPCSRSWLTPREPYPAHVTRLEETGQQGRPSTLEARRGAGKPTQPATAHTLPTPQKTRFFALPHKCVYTDH